VVGLVPTGQAWYIASALLVVFRTFGWLVRKEAGARRHDVTRPLQSEPAKKVMVFFKAIQTRKWGT